MTVVEWLSYVRYYVTSGQNRELLDFLIDNGHITRAILIYFFAGYALVIYVFIALVIVGVVVIYMDLTKRG